MIITQKKPLEEVLAMVGDAKTVAVIGCGLCASTCQTGGAPEVEAMKQTLEEAGKTVVVTDVADACCMKLGVRAKCKAISAAAPECIVCMSCGDGVQTIAKNCTGIPVYPANNTMFLGEVARVGIWEEACKMCGDCVLRRPEERQVRSKPRKRLRVDSDLQSPRAARSARQAVHDAPGQGL